VSDSASSAPPQPGQSSSSDPIVVFGVDLGCLLCGRTIGTFETRRWPWFGPVVLRPPHEAPAVSVANWSRLRCLTCGGNVYPDEVRTVKRYPFVSLDDLELPRRGRPPRWLVEQRLAARSTSDD
jgi:hypothetical protein